MSRHLPEAEDRSLARAFAATVAAAAVSCATFDAFGFPQVAGLLFFVIGGIGALRRLAARSDHAQSVPGRHGLAPAVLRVGA